MNRIIHPPLDAHAKLRQPMTDGEQAVLKLFLEHLPSSWEIYIQPHLNGLRPDFVLLNPKAGIAVFEVKDWNLDAMRYFTQKDSSGHVSLWAERDGKSFSIQSNNPITKVSLYKEAIFELYCPRLGSQFGWAAITAGVIFPFADASRAEALLAPFIKSNDNDDYAKYQPVSGRKEIAAGAIKAVFPEVVRSSSFVMTEALAADLRGWLVEPDFSLTQRQPLELDRNQRSLAESRTESGYRRIKGPAGSGKSLVLAARAARLMNEGKSVLIATFNITLWHYLRDLVRRGVDSSEQFSNVVFTNFHRWCRDVCCDVGWQDRYNDLWKEIPDKEPARSARIKEILDVELPALADEAVAQPGATRYDAIFVDEGQDYRPSWWNALRKACKPGGEVVLVADATQDVYGTARAWTDEAMTQAGFPGGRWAQLSISYRVPPIALNVVRDFAGRFLPGETLDLPEPEQGALNLFPCNLRWVQCESNQSEEVCVREVLSLMRQTGGINLSNADITFLTDDVRFGREVITALESHRVRAVSTFAQPLQERRRQKMGFYMGDARIKATTLQSFKGWEARLLVVHVAQARTRESLALVYAGLTRLKRSSEGSWLTVVCSAPELEEYGRSWPDSISKA